jgi:formylglycine-generating enzyme required for sulfatase activity
MRLPTEAEWEFAYRAGTTTAYYAFPGFPNGTNNEAFVGQIAWIQSNSNGRTQPIGQKLPNGLGFYDMAGNVGELVRDWYSGTYYASSPAMDPQGPSSGSIRIIRGGTWDDPPAYHRASDRVTLNNYMPWHRGLRVARNP